MLGPDESNSSTTPVTDDVPSTPKPTVCNQKKACKSVRLNVVPEFSIREGYKCWYKTCNECRAFQKERDRMKKADEVDEMPTRCKYDGTKPGCMSLCNDNPPQFTVNSYGCYSRTCDDCKAIQTIKYGIFERAWETTIKKLQMVDGETYHPSNIHKLGIDDVAHTLVKVEEARLWRIEIPQWFQKVHGSRIEQRYHANTEPVKCKNVGNSDMPCQSETQGISPTFGLIRLYVQQPVWHVECNACREHKHRIQPIEPKMRTNIEEKPLFCSNSKQSWLSCQSSRLGQEAQFTMNINHGIYSSSEGDVIKEPKWFDKCDSCREYQARPTDRHCKTCQCWVGEHEFISENGKHETLNCQRCRERFRRQARRRLSTKINSIREGAKKRKYTVHLTDKQMGCLLRTPCLYCGSLDEHGFSGIDRIVSSIGQYRPGNVVPCCPQCNRTKSILSIQTFVERMYHYFYHHHLSDDTPVLTFPKAFKNPNPDTVTFEQAMSIANTNDYEFLMGRDEYYATLHGICMLCKINAATRLLRYRRPGPLASNNCITACSHCGNIVKGVSPHELPDMAMRVVTHLEKTGLLMKLRRNQSVYTVEDDDTVTE